MNLSFPLSLHLHSGWVCVALSEAWLYQKNYSLNFIRNKGGDGVKNNLLAFGRDHFKHQMCHQVILEYAQNFENVMSVVTKSQHFFKEGCHQACLWPLQHVDFKVLLQDTF